MASLPTGPILFQFGNLAKDSAIDPKAISTAELEHEDEIDLDPIPVPRAAIRPPPRLPRAPALSQITSTNLIELAKARLTELELQLATMAGLQAERDALERLVKAAETPSS